MHPSRHRFLQVTALTLCTALGLISCTEEESTAQKAAREGLVLIGNNAEPQSLDPHKATAVSDGRIISCLLEGLVRAHPANAQEILPATATSWSHNEDASEWTFTLRDDARWSDGTAVKASDFCYAYQRMLHPQFGAKYAEMLYPLKGAQAYNEGQATWDEVGVKAIDDKTLKLTFAHPTPNLLQVILHFTWSPIPAHIVEAQGGMLDRRSLWTQAANWVGNGAYVLKEHRFNHYLDLAASPTYWRSRELQNKGIRFLPIVNGFTETRMFLDGKLHISNNVPPEMIAYAKQEAPEAYQQHPYYCCIFYRLNTQRPPLNDLRVRKALSLAIDRDALVKQVVRGAGVPTQLFTPPSDNYNVTQGDIPPTQEARLSLARRLLAEAGFENGHNFPTLELMTSSREVQRIMAESIQAMWLEALGVRVQIQVKEWTAYKAAQQAMNYDFSSSSWSGDFLDPSNFVSLWRSGGGNNCTGWASQNFDAQLDQANASTDAQARLKHLAQAERIMLDAQAIIPLYWSERCYLQVPYVKGFYPSLLETQALDAVNVSQHD